jgi:hypothetical protein
MQSEPQSRRALAAAQWAYDNAEEEFDEDEDEGAGLDDDPEHWFP